LGALTTCSNVVNGAFRSFAAVGLLSGDAGGQADVRLRRRSFPTATIAVDRADANSEYLDECALAMAATNDLFVLTNNGFIQRRRSARRLQ